MAFSPSWSDATKYQPSAGVLPDISYDPKSWGGSFESNIDWNDAFKYKPSPGLFDKPKTGKDFLDEFAAGLQGTNKYQKQAQQGGYQTGGDKGTSGGGVGQIGPDAFIYTPQPQYSPFTVTTPGRPGLGGAIANIAGAALAPFTGGASIPIAGAVGGLFG